VGNVLRKYVEPATHKFASGKFMFRRYK